MVQPVVFSAFRSHVAGMNLPCLFERVAQKIFFCVAGAITCLLEEGVISSAEVGWNGIIPWEEIE